MDDGPGSLLSVTALDEDGFSIPTTETPEGCEVTASPVGERFHFGSTGTRGRQDEDAFRRWVVMRTATVEQAADYSLTRYADIRQVAIPLSLELPFTSGVAMPASADDAKDAGETE